MPVTVETEGTSVVVRITMQIKRRMGRKEVIVPQGLDEAPQAGAQEPLVVALARAFHWQDLLDAGRYSSISELAVELRVDRCYVRRILNLATLAPDLITALVEGREPSGLSLERLVKGVPLPWHEQMEIFGFTR